MPVVEEETPAPDVSPLRLAQHDIFGGTLAIEKPRAWHPATRNMHTGLVTVGAVSRALEIGG